MRGNLNKRLETKGKKVETHLLSMASVVCIDIFDLKCSSLVLLFWEETIFRVLVVFHTTPLAQSFFDLLDLLLLVVVVLWVSSQARDVPFHIPPTDCYQCTENGLIEGSSHKGEAEERRIKECSKTDFLNNTEEVLREFIC